LLASFYSVKEISCGINSSQLFSSTFVVGLAYFAVFCAMFLYRFTKLTSVAVCFLVRFVEWQRCCCGGWNISTSVYFPHISMVTNS